MIIGIYTIRDAVAGSTLGIKTFVNDAVAIRDFKNCVVVNQADFDLLKIGSYDTHDGKLHAIEPIVLCAGIDLIKKEE